MDLYTLQIEVHKMAKEKGWWDDDYPGLIGEKLLLVNSEVCEAFEEYRVGHDVKEVYEGENGKPEGVPIELADAVIRILDFAQRYGIDLERALVAKMAYNQTRPHRHGGKRA